MWCPVCLVCCSENSDSSRYIGRIIVVLIEVLLPFFQRRGGKKGTQTMKGDRKKQPRDKNIHFLEYYAMIALIFLLAGEDMDTKAHGRKHEERKHVRKGRQGNSKILRLEVRAKMKRK